MAVEYHTKIRLEVPVAQITDDEDVVTKEYVDTQIEEASSKYSEVLAGDGTKTSFTVHHELDTDDIVISIWDNTSHRIVFADVTITDADNVEVGFAEAPATGTDYKVIVIG